MPAYRENFGVYVNEEVGYQLTPQWQAGLGQMSGIGSILAIFASAWFQQRYGYRRLLQIGLVAMFCFIFIVFFAQNIVSDVTSCRLLSELNDSDHARHWLPSLRLGLVCNLIP